MIAPIEMSIPPTSTISSWARAAKASGTTRFDAVCSWNRVSSSGLMIT